MIYFIQKLGFQDLVFLVPRHNSINEISKTMVFVDKIENAIKLEKYLYLRLPDCIRNGNQAFVVIRSFTSNLDTNIRIKVIENLRHGNT